MAKTYTKKMNIFVKTASVNKPKTGESQQIAYAYAGILVIILVAQLFTFDKFLILLESFWLPGGVLIAHLVGSVIVCIELLALPFLLRLNLSPLMRIVSMVSGWLVPIVWLKLALWLIFTVNAVSNFGLLGTTISMIPGWWTVFICIAIGVMAAWASWGLWPVKHK